MAILLNIASDLCTGHLTARLELCIVLGGNVGGGLSGIFMPQRLVTLLNSNQNTSTAGICFSI